MPHSYLVAALFLLPLLRLIVPSAAQFSCLKDAVKEDWCESSCVDENPGPDDCYDQDLGKADARQKGCRDYSENDCKDAERYADDNFNANILCCKCKGGFCEPESFSEKVKVTALEWLEYAFHLAAHWSWKILQTCFYSGAVSVLVWLVSWCLMRYSAASKRNTETGDAETGTGSGIEGTGESSWSCPLRVTTPLASAYLGTIYVLYVITVPAFGRPKVQEETETEKEGEGEREGETGIEIDREPESGQTEGPTERKITERSAGCCDIQTWLNPGFPHFGPAYWERKENGEMDTSCLQLVVNSLRLVLNGFAISLLPYILLLALMLAISMAIITPAVLIFFGLLIIIARVADKAAKSALEGGTTGKVKPEEEEKPEPPKGRFRRFLDSFWNVLFRAFGITLMFIVDFLVLFSIMVNISHMFPEASLPVFDIDMFKDLAFFDIVIPQFLLDLALWLKNIFSFLKMPDWELRCQSFNTMSSLFNLFLTAVAISVILGSDIIAVVYDRQNRIGSHEETDVDPQESCIKTSWRKLKRKVVKGVIDGSQFLIWQAVTVITNSVSLYIILNFQRLQKKKGGKKRDETTGDWSLAPDECTLGMHAISVIITCYIGICTFFYIIRVITGLVYKDGTWILTASLVQEERLFSKASAHRLMAIMKLTLGAFLMPGASLGLTKSHIEAIKDEFYKLRPAEEQKQEGDAPGHSSKVKRSVIMFCPECYCVTTEDDVNDKKHIQHREGCSTSKTMMKFLEPKPEYFYDEQGCMYVKGVYDLTEKGSKIFADLTQNPDKMREVLQEILARNLKAEQQGRGNSGNSLVNHLKNVGRNLVGFFSARTLLAEALLDLQVQSETFGHLPFERIKEEYFRLHDQEFDLSRLSDFRLADFLESAIAAFETRGEHPVKCRLWQLISMPWGVMRGKQFPTVHTSERCILWASQVEQVARASGMSYAITIFAVPFIGPFLGKAFMYLNEVPAFVRMSKDLRAGDYTYKQSPPDNAKWCQEGSQGLDPSWFLKILWVFNFLKVVVLYLAIYKPRGVMIFTAVVFVMSLISGFFVEKEKRIWKERDELLEGVRRNHIRRERIHMKRLTEESRAQLRDQDTRAKEAAWKKWDAEATARDEAARTALQKTAFRDEVPEYELKPLELLIFERTRVESCDIIVRDAERLIIESVKLNAKLRANTVELRQKLQQRTKDFSAELQKKGAKHQERHPAVKGLMNVFMPSVAGRYADMLKDAPEVHQETLNSVLQRKISQWRLFLGSMSAQDVDLSKLQQELANILPDYDIEDVKNKVKKRELDMDVASMKAFRFDVKACFKGHAATIMQQEVNLVKAIVEMAVDMLAEVFNFLKQAKDMCPNLAEGGAKSLREMAALAEQEATEAAGREAADQQAAVDSAANWMPGTKTLVSKEEQKTRDYSKYKFMLSKQELERRLHNDKEKLEELYSRIQTLCFNILLVLEAIKTAIDEGKTQLQKVIDSSSGILGWLGAPTQMTCCIAENNEDQMVMMTTLETLRDDGILFTNIDLEMGAQGDVFDQPVAEAQASAEVEPVEEEGVEAQDSQKELEHRAAEEGKEEEEQKKEASEKEEKETENHEAEEGRTKEDQKGEASEREENKEVDKKEE